MKTTNQEIISEEENRDSKLKKLEVEICSKKGHVRNGTFITSRLAPKYCNICHKHISLW